jgi:alpha-D-xyloside xylohydrolase
MKFIDGNWQMRPGVTGLHPVHVHDVEVQANSVTLFAPTRLVQHRGATLDQAMFTIRLSAPQPGTVRVEVWRHGGQPVPSPCFELNLSSVPPQITVDDRAVTFTSGDLTVVIERATWRMAFLHGQRRLTGSAARALGLMNTPDGRFIREELDLGVGECIYGLGERFTAFVKNGQTVETWNRDGGTGTEQAYKCVPFYLSNRGYGVFVNNPGPVAFEIASERVSRVQFSVAGERLDYLFVGGGSPAETVRRYTAVTGRPALPPAWSFGLWLTTSFTTDYDEGTVTSFVEEMAHRDLPLHVFHFDCFWMREFHWCNFEWDTRVFPDPEGMLARLKARGLHICVWINPYIAQRSALFAEGMANGYLLRRPDGSVWQTDQWQAGMGIVDFTNPEACTWYADKLGALIDMGVDCFKTDFGERIPTDVVYHDGSDPERMHNYYTYLYNRTVFRLLECRLGRGQAVLFARSATAGGQQFPVHWGGDCSATFESMAESLRGGLSLGLSGFAFWSHDIGGFEQTASADVYKRWCAFGLLSSHSRLHGNSSYRVPWLYDEEAVDVLRFFTKLKCRLMPYLFAKACEARDTGLPLLRAMVLEFPDDPACAGLDRQYMLGDSLLVAPVFCPEGQVDYYVPEGRWTNVITGKEVQGGRWVRERHGFMSLPLLARPNSLIAFGANDQRPDYDFDDGVVLHLFGLEQDATATVTVPTPVGAPSLQMEVMRHAEHLTVCPAQMAPRGSWQFLLRGGLCALGCEGGTVESHSDGILITPGSPLETLTIRLA